MATIRRLRGRWQGMVRRRGVPLRCKSFDKRTDAARWARELESEADRSGWVADTRLAEKTTLGELLTRYRDQVSPTKRSAHTEKARINECRPLIAVGTRITARPPHRSVRAQFGHTAPTSGV